MIEFEYAPGRELLDVPLIFIALSHDAGKAGGPAILDTGFDGGVYPNSLSHKIGAIRMSTIKYWKDIDVLNIEIKKGDYEYSQEVAEGVTLDVSKEGDIMAIEILDATKKMDQPIAQKLAQKYAVVKA